MAVAFSRNHSDGVLFFQPAFFLLEKELSFSWEGRDNNRVMQFLYHIWSEEVRRYKDK